MRKETALINFETTISMNNPDIGSPSSRKSIHSARKRSSTTQSAWALASERFTPPPPIKLPLTSKGPFTCPNEGKRRRSTISHERRSVPKRKMSDETYLRGHRTPKSDNVNGPYFHDERDDINMRSVRLFDTLSPFQKVDDSRRERTEGAIPNFIDTSKLRSNEHDAYFKDKIVTSPTKKRNSTQTYIDHSLFQLKNEVSDLVKEVKSKNDQIDKLTADGEKQRQRLSVERNLRIQAELKEVTASHAAYAKASEEARRMAVEQVN